MAAGWLSTFVGSLLGAIVALGAVWLASRLAVGRTRAERVWDRKAEAYSVIFEALYEMEEWFDDNLDDEMLRRDVDQSVQARRNASYRSAQDRLFRTVAKEEWVLPVDVTERFRTLWSTLHAHYESWFEDLDAGSAAVHKTKKWLVEFARKDLA